MLVELAHTETLRRALERLAETSADVPVLAYPLVQLQEVVVAFAEALQQGPAQWKAVLERFAPAPKTSEKGVEALRYLTGGRTWSPEEKRELERHVSALSWP